MTRYQINHSDLESTYQSKGNCLQQFLPSGLGGGYSSTFQLDAGLTFIDSHFTPSKDLAIFNQLDNSESKVIITLGLDGSSCFIPKGGSEVSFKKGYTTITSANSTLGERQYLADDSIHQLRLICNKKWLDKYMGEEHSSQLLKESSLQVLSCEPIAYQSLLGVKALLKVNELNPMKMLSMHAQAMAILTNELDSLLQVAGQKVENLHDQELAYLARDILFKEIKSPPSVEALAKEVGTNSFKLKQLFHQYFDTTPYGLLLQYRMEKAYAMLEAEHCHVGIAADLVGYKHASNFSSAFIKYFGVSPKIVAK